MINLDRGDVIGLSSLREVQAVLDDLLIAMQADFSRYKKWVPSLRILEVFESVIGQTCGKFVFTKADIRLSLENFTAHPPIRVYPLYAGSLIQERGFFVGEK